VSPLLGVYSAGMITRKLLLAGIAGGAGLLLGCWREKSKDCPYCCTVCGGSAGFDCVYCEPDGSGKCGFCTPAGSGKCGACEPTGSGKCRICQGGGKVGWLGSEKVGWGLTCGHCKGSGKCGSCQGSGECGFCTPGGTRKCYRCEAVGSGKCPRCKGSGKRACLACEGKLQSPKKCSKCRGAGRVVRCMACDGVGFNKVANDTCNLCWGDGWAPPAAADE